jgi:hypothetical protein
MLAIAQASPGSGTTVLYVAISPSAFDVSPLHNTFSPGFQPFFLCNTLNSACMELKLQQKVAKEAVNTHSNLAWLHRA